jgi:heme-degrading monooxygenase HmoA
MTPGYMYMWEYVVARDTLGEFERIYGPEGEWVRLFGRAAGYVRTELHRDRRAPCRFVTIDYWESESAWKAFRVQFAESFEDLDARCAALTTRETELGKFEPVGCGRDRS